MSGFGRDLVGNVNCGTANPLMQMAGQMQGMGAQLSDVRSFGGAEKGVMMGARPPMSQADLMRPPTGQPGGDSSHFMNAFQQQKPMGGMSMPLQLQQQQQHRQMHHMQQQRMIPPQQQQQVGPDQLADQFMQMEMQQQMQSQFESAFHQPASHGPAPEMWGNEFQQQHQQRMMHHAAQHKMMQHQQPSNWSARMMGPMGGMGMGMMGMGMGGMGMMGNSMMMGPSSLPAAPAAASSSSSAAVVQEMPADAIEEEFDTAVSGATQHASLDEAYAAATADMTSPVDSGSWSGASGLSGGMDKEMLDKLMNSDNPKWRNSKFLRFIDKISKGEIEFQGNQAIERPPGSVPQQREWEHVDYNPSSMQGADWADEFSVQQNHPASWSDEYAGDATKTQAEQWLEDAEARGELDTEFKDFDWQQALSRAKDEIHEQQKDPEYQFAQQNPFDSAADAFNDGVQLFKEGRIKEAILAFESTVQKQPDHADAWAYLGEAQAQNEEESNAIAAFLQCVAIDPYNLKALLQLGVSYTNDLEEHRALNYLKTWMENNPDYQGAALTQQKQNLDQYNEFYGGGNAHPEYSYDNHLHDEVTKMFLNALSIRPDDADLHTVLGVLYHISSDFDKAIEAFKNAVKLKPDDAALWNKLGATQANSSRSEDAVHAYKRALQLRPSYVRALANLAISFANQGLHEDAVRTYLATLTHNTDANHVWSYLKISLAHLQREELVEIADQKNVELFRPFFQF